MKSLALMFMITTASAEVLIPDNNITPGAIDPLATPTSICEDGTSAVRHTTSGMKALAYKFYKVDKHSGICAPEVTGGRGCEVDHRIPLAIGGADRQQNLWPQPFPQAAWKDRLELDYYHRICMAHNANDDDAALAVMREAQEALAGDWREAYRDTFGPLPGE